MGNLTTRFMTGLLAGIALFTLAGCATQPPPPVIVTGDSVTRTRIPEDISKPIQAQVGTVFYSDTITATSDGAVLKGTGSRDSSMGIWHRVPERTRLMMVSFDGVQFFCTMEPTAGSFPIDEPQHYSCYQDEQNDGWFDAVHPVMGNPATGRSSRPLERQKLPVPVPYQRERIDTLAGTMTWQLVYAGLRDGYAQIDHVIRAGAGPDGEERYRRSYYLPLADMGQPFSFLIIPYAPFSGSWVRDYRNGFVSLALMATKADAREMTVTIDTPWPQAKILKKLEMRGRFQTLPTRWAIMPKS